MIIAIAVEDYAIVECDDMEEGDVTGYKFNYDQLVEFASWLSEEYGPDYHVVLGTDRLAIVLYDDEQSYIEQISIRLDKENNIFKVYDCWESNPYWNQYEVTWFNEERLMLDVIRCFKSTDNIVFNKTPQINYYEYDDGEDE